jgi:hypothetical protein
VPVKLLNLFAQPPFSLWEREYNYGERVAADAGLISDEVGLATDQTDLFLFAACNGELSVGAPISSPVRPEELPDPPESPSLPDVIDLCLVMNPVVRAVADFAAASASALGGSAAIASDVFAFLYWNIDVASLMEDLREALRWSTVPPGDMNIDANELERRMSLFLTGSLSVYVDAGERLGRPGPHPDPVGGMPFHVGLSVVTSSGLWSPGDIYYRYRALIDADDSDIDDFLVLVPKPANLFSSASSKSAAIALTESRLYPFTELLTLRNDWSLTRADWRRVGDNQKSLHRKRLLARHGVGPAGAAVEPFEFNSADWQNLFQLEAIVEFFINFPDPWLPNARPIDVASDGSSIDRTTLVLQGSSARKTGGQFQLDGNPDLSRVQPFRHRLYLAASNGEHWYQITAVDVGRKRITAVDSSGAAPVLQSGQTISAWRIDLYQIVDFLPLEGASATISGSGVTLDGTPDLSGMRTMMAGRLQIICDAIVFTSTPDRMYRIADADQVAFRLRLADAPAATSGPTSAWRICRAPILVLIDPLGPREGLRGTSATVGGLATPNVLLLEEPIPKLDKVSPGSFDTIYLPGDSARASKTYRILHVDAAAHTVTVDGSPSFGGGTSPWAIPAGLGGTLPPMNYNLGPGSPKDIAGGFDHYDGAIFVIDDGEITDQFRYTSFTSRTTKTANRRSILGNRRYDVVSFTSTSGRGADYRNYCFKVNDRANNDNVFQARSYFDTPVTAGGQQKIRLHYGNLKSKDGGSGSEGCNVSPDYFHVRRALIKSFQRRHVLLQGPGGSRDARLDLLAGTVSYADNLTLWNKTFKPPAPESGVPPPEGVPADAWDNKIFCHYWVIRPNERPV